MPSADRNTRFPVILHTILKDAVVHKFEHIISWIPNSDHLFKVHNWKAFERSILKKYFRDQNHFKSFTRQLNLYGFRRIATANDGPPAHRGAYHHPMFVRGDIDLSMDMDRPKAWDRRSSKTEEELKETLRGKPEMPTTNSSISEWSKQARLPLREVTTSSLDDICCEGSVSLVARIRLETPSSLLVDMAEDIIYLFGININCTDL